MCEDEDIIEIGDTNNKILEIFNGYKDILNSREREIIRRRYGILGEKPVTQRELAAEMNISRSYVSRIEKKALEKLKKYIENHIDFK